jgi:hypothetical protein
VFWNLSKGTYFWSYAFRIVMYLGCVTIDGVWIGEWICWPLTPLGTTSNTASSLIYTLYISPLHTLSGSQYSIVVSWQRISTQWLYQSYGNRHAHEVVFSQSHSCNSPNSQLSSLLNHFQLLSQETPLIIIQLARDPCYIASGWTQQKTPFRSS